MDFLYFLFFIPLNVFNKGKFLLIWWESIQVTRPLSCLIETNSCIIHVYRIHYFYMNLNKLYLGFLGPLNTCLKRSWCRAPAFMRTSYVKSALDYYGHYGNTLIEAIVNNSSSMKGSCVNLLTQVIGIVNFWQYKFTSLSSISLPVPAVHTDNTRWQLI